MSNDKSKVGKMLRLAFRVCIGIALLWVSSSLTLAQAGGKPFTDYFQGGKLYLEKGDFEKAAKDFTESLRLNPHRDEIDKQVAKETQAYLGKVNVELKKIADAKKLAAAKRAAELKKRAEARQLAEEKKAKLLAARKALEAQKRAAELKKRQALKKQWEAKKQLAAQKRAAKLKKREEERARIKAEKEKAKKEAAKETAKKKEKEDQSK